MSTEALAEHDDYRVTLESFEGPLDLLLHLIRKNDIDIYDIPIAQVLDQYVEYLELARELNIDLAGDFLLTASELLHIKSQLLVPTERGETEEEGPDPRAELVRRLLEYQRYKEAAKQLWERPLLGRDVFTRKPAAALTEAEATVASDMTSLLVAFQQVLKRIPPGSSYEIPIDRISVSDRIVSLTEQLRGAGAVKFAQLFDGSQWKADVVVTFLALLEMAKMNMIEVQQGEVFDDIFIVSKIMAADPEEGETWPV